MAENTTFLEGRHKNRSYQQVFESDKQFCDSVMNSKESSKYYPADFKKFLLSKLAANERCESNSMTVCERTPFYFLQALSADMKDEFRNIVGDHRVTVKEIHQPCNFETPTNGFLGVFYRFFVKKCVFNLQNKDGRCKFVEKYASVFPFTVSRVDCSRSLPVLQLFDDRFQRRLQKFLNRHFDNVLIEDIAPIFLSNIHKFRQQNFSENDAKRLTSLVKILQNGSFNGDGEHDKFRAFRRGNYINTYLTNFPRLNEAGVARYKNMYQTYKQITLLFHESEVADCNKQQFMNLPEINCYEMFSLLDEEFFIDRFDSYIALFEKYVFFFVRALDADEKPVFFIDSVLFECLKSLNKFEKSREDVFDLQYEFAMLTLVYRRKQPVDSRRPDYTIDQTNLMNVKNYIENVPGIGTALVDHELANDLLECTIFLYFEDGTCFDFYFSKIKRTGLSDFHFSILCGALSPEVKRLVIYNAYRGQESSLNMPADYEKLQEFIRRYNQCDFTAPLPAEKFITWGFEYCFVENTIH